MKSSIVCIAAVLALASAAAPAADNFPSRPIRFIVPFSPGGSTDTLARGISIRLGESLGQQVVVDNRPGGNGNIGTEMVARAVPDGYTIVLGYIANLGIGPSLYAKMPFDPVKDFAPITLVAEASNIVVIHPSVPATDLKTFIVYAKANPGKVTFASSSIASVGHLTGELLNQLAGIDMVHVPYKGSGQAITDLVGGHIKVMISGMASTLPHVHSGKLRAIATTGANRTPATPNVPTIAESGFPKFEATSWFGVLAPARTLPAVVNRLNADIRQALKQPDVRDRLATAGFDVVSGTPEAFAAYIKSEIAKWAKVVKAAKVTAE